MQFHTEDFSVVYLPLVGSDLVADLGLGRPTVYSAAVVRVQQNTYNYKLKCPHFI